MSDTTDFRGTANRTDDHLFLPFLSNFYERFAKPFAWVALRVAVGGVLAYEGWRKMGNPMAMSGFVESLNFYPGWFWSPLLGLVNLVGGLFIVFGFLTRPAALANTFMLAITLWYHYVNPYGPTFLTPEGIAFMQTPEAAQYFTADAMRRLGDGGANFLNQVQGKAIFASLFWTGAAGLFAAFGGGALSIDNRMKKEF